jgi:AcrR family transcriptional regulator
VSEFPLPGGTPVPDGRQRLLDAAVRLLDAHGESALRMTAIAEEAGVAVGLITHHFGSRDGLVVAAQQVRVAGAVAADVATIEAILLDVDDPQVLRERLAVLTAAIVDVGRASARMSRVAALASAHGRPAAGAALGETVGELLGSLEVLIEGARERGLVRADVDPRALATLLQAYSLGLVLADLDPDRADPDALLEHLTRALEVFLVDPGPASG